MNYKMIFDLYWRTSKNILFLTSEDFLLVDVNPISEKIFQCKKSQILNRNVSFFLKEKAVRHFPELNFFIGKKK